MYCLVCERDGQTSSLYCESCGYALVEESPAGSLCCFRCGTEAEEGEGGHCRECGAELLRLVQVAPSERERDWGRLDLATAGYCLGCGVAVRAQQRFCRDCEAELAFVTDAAPAAKGARPPAGRETNNVTDAAERFRPPSAASNGPEEMTETGWVERLETGSEGLSREEFQILHLKKIEAMESLSKVLSSGPPADTGPVERLRLLRRQV
jgi:hypothetical protein